MAKKDSKTYMLEHSKAKVELYSKYLSKYIRIIGNDKYTSKINIYDLFCGEGIYDNGGKGSPIACLDVLKNHYLSNEKKICDTKLLFNDINSQKIEKLEKAIENHTNNWKPDNCKVVFSVKMYADIINDVKKEVSNYKEEKALVFIDPYGYKEIDIQDIKDILCNKKSEVLLFLPISFMYRFANKAISKEENDNEQKNAFEPLRNLLQSLDIDDKSYSSVHSFINALKCAFEKFLVDFYIDTFTIARDNKGTYFCLFFFSSHIKGFEKMLETKWEIDKEEGRGWEEEKTQNMFAEKELKTTLEEKLLNILDTPKNNKELYKYILIHGFLPKHANEILAKLQNEQKIEVVLAGDNNTKARKGAFYISYEYFNSAPKVIFSTNKNNLLKSNTLLLF